MFRLRILREFKYQDDFIFDKHHVTRKAVKDTLQFRQVEAQVTRDLGDLNFSTEHQWSEWQDVPIEEIDVSEMARGNP